MSGGFPFISEIAGATSVGHVLSASRGTQVTCNASANTKGNWVELVAATAADTVAVGVCLSNVGATTAFNFAFDIGIGPQNSEVVVASNLMLSSCITNARATRYITLPLQIPAGTRIAARVQSPTGSQVASIHLILFDGAMIEGEGIAGWDDIGFNASTTLGTDLTNTSTSKPATFTQLIAATARDYAAFFLSTDTLGAQAAQNQYFLCDVAIGAAGAEKIILSDLQCDRDYGSGGYNSPAFTDVIPHPIKAGSRISARVAPSSGSGGYHMGLILYGGYK